MTIHDLSLSGIARVRRDGVRLAVTCLLVSAVLQAAPVSRPVSAQEAVQGDEVTPARVSSAPGAMLRGLDKVSGLVTEIDIAVGHTIALGKLQVTLGDCRYYASNPAGEAFAYLVIREGGVEQPRFQGWMAASSPALNALEHPRYDIWVMRCKT